MGEHHLNAMNIAKFCAALSVLLTCNVPFATTSEFTTGMTLSDLNSATASLKLFETTNFTSPKLPASTSVLDSLSPKLFMAVITILAVVGATVVGTRMTGHDFVVSLWAHILVALAGATYQQNKSAKCINDQEKDDVNRNLRQPRSRKTLKPVRPTKDKMVQRDVEVKLDLEYKEYLARIDEELNNATVEKDDCCLHDSPFSDDLDLQLDGFLLDGGHDDVTDFYDGWEGDNFDWEGVERNSPPAGMPMAGPFVGTTPSAMLRLPIAQVAPSRYLASGGHVEPKSLWPNEARFFMNWAK